MNAYKVNLREKYSFLQGGVLECILSGTPYDNEEQSKAWKRPAVIVVPGGAYGMVSKREGEPIAHNFLSRGFQVFILTYLVAKDNVRYPEQLLELGSAVDYIRKNAEEMHVNGDEIFVVGFSAGGHLTGNLAVEYASVSEKAGQALDCKPTAVGLCYPVISRELGHAGSHNNLLQGYTEEEQAKLCKTLNLNEGVSAETPPAFIWSTTTDRGVPPRNALKYAMALDEHGIGYELHIYPEGPHGISTGDFEVCSPNHHEKPSHWMNDCAEFFRLYTVEKF